MKKDIEKIVEFIKESVDVAGKSGCMIGISGGIDSAVVAALCKLAFPENTYGVSMPRFDYQQESTKRAHELCKHLEIPLYVDEILFDQKYHSFQEDIHITVDNLEAKIKMAEGNFSARMRMAKLYYHAEMNDCLVIGTDNACENFIGYFTKYGDGGVDINPIGEYFKSDVYKLAKELNNNQAGKIMIPDSITDAIPSAELFDNHTDEDELGFSYDELEWAIGILKYNDFDEYEDFEAISLPDDKLNILIEVWKMHMRTQHKRDIPENGPEKGFNL